MFSSSRCYFHIFCFSFKTCWRKTAVGPRSHHASNRSNVFFMAKLGGQGWGCTKDCRTETRHRYYQMALRAMGSSFTWINETCRQTPTYSSLNLQHNLALRLCPSILFCNRRSRAKSSTHSTWNFNCSHEVDFQIQVVLKRETFQGRGGSTSFVPPVSHTWRYMKPHIPHRV